MSGARRGAWLGAWLGLLVLAACTSKQADSARGDLDPKAVQADLERWCDESDGLLAWTPGEVPPAPWPEPARPGPITSEIVEVIVSPAGILVDGQRVGDGALARVLEDRRRSWALIATADAPLPLVAEALEQLRGTLGPTGRLHFRNPEVTLPRSPDPARSRALAEQIATTPIERRASDIAREAEVVTRGCSALVTGFENVGPISPEQRCRRLAPKIAAGLAACPEVDHVGVLALLYATDLGVGLARAELAIELADAGDAEATHLHYFADETWAEVVDAWFARPPSGPIVVHGLDPAQRDASTIWGVWHRAASGLAAKLQLREAGEFTLHWASAETPPSVVIGRWELEADDERDERMWLKLEPASEAPTIELMHRTLTPGAAHAFAIDGVGGDELRLCGEPDSCVELRR